MGDDNFHLETMTSSISNITPGNKIKTNTLIKQELYKFKVTSFGFLGLRKNLDGAGILERSDDKNFNTILQNNNNVH